MLSELASPHIRCCPSDLMKSKAVDESLSSMNQQFCSRENQLLQMLQQNEKSTQIILENYGIGLLKLLRDWRSSNLDSVTSRIIEYLLLDVYTVS